MVFTFYAFYVCTAGLPAVYFSILASSVIVIAAVPGLLPPLGILALGFRLQIPELLSDTLSFGRFLLRLGFTFAIDRLLPCGQITIVLFHEGRSGVIRPLECLHVGIAVLFENVGQPVLSAPMIKCKKTPRKKCSFVAEVKGKR